jgi:hypothetical protein
MVANLIACEYSHMSLINMWKGGADGRLIDILMAE